MRDDMKEEITKVQYNVLEDEYYISTPMFDQMGWKEGDTIEWQHSSNGVFVLKKIKDAA